MKRRLDILLVEKALVGSREKAHSVIMAGEVLVNGALITKPATRVDEDGSIELRQKPPFVSRGGIKLAHALEYFHLDVLSLVALDVGASTGGFTDCLLKRGASRVYAVDVVVTMERINARYPFKLPETVDLITIDISFISLEKVIPNVSNLTRRGGNIICLVKPQFEAGRGQVGKGGLIKDPLVHAEVLGKFISWSIERGFRIRGLTPSPILGATGNREFFVLLEV
jgi:23S rRNA (cytidine1920-2'-O)/16S rRNA (cytidine1409-2'-O)-methyltransferase